LLLANIDLDVLLNNHKCWLWVSLCTHYKYTCGRSVVYGAVRRPPWCL